MLGRHCCDYVFTIILQIRKQVEETLSQGHTAVLGGGEISTQSL